jgi:hypothetical protein
MTGWGDFRHDPEREKPMAKETPTAGSGRCLPAMAGTKVKKIPKFVVTPAKAICRGGVTEPTHRTIWAPDPAMILFDPVVEILADPCRRRL